MCKNERPSPPAHRILVREGRVAAAQAGAERIGLYPIVDSVAWLERLLPLGVQTIQLRIKNQSHHLLDQAVAQSVAIAQAFNARLFINDYWELAIKYKAYGVHLGQEDLQQTSLKKITEAGLRLGISTHSPEEIDNALAWDPSYIAFGPIYETHTKKMAFAPQGLEQLKYWIEKLDYPVVAIGGINLERFSDVLAMGVDGIAMISAITQAKDPEGATRKFLSKLENFPSRNKS